MSRASPLARADGCWATWCRSWRAQCWCGGTAVSVRPARIGAAAIDPPLPSTLPVRAVLLYVWMVLRIAATNEGHSGYAFPWSLTRLYPNQGDAHVRRWRGRGGGGGRGELCARDGARAHCLVVAERARTDACNAQGWQPCVMCCTGCVMVAMRTCGTRARNSAGGCAPMLRGRRCAHVAPAPAMLLAAVRPRADAGEAHERFPCVRSGGC
jgi:hypothetical protein